MSLGFSVDALLPKARGGGQLRMGLVKLEERDEELPLLPDIAIPQGRGNWGEKMLVDILMQAGFERGINYEMQEKLEGCGKPDFTFHLPPDRVLYLDSKFPMENYLKYFEAQDDNTRKIMKDAFIENVEDRVKELQDRDYVQQSNANALDYVLLFIPNEGVLGFIQQHKPSLIDEAVAKRVVLCSPLTLYAFLVVIRQAADSFHTEQTAATIMQRVNQFGKEFEKYSKSVDEVSKLFNKLQEELDSIGTGGTRFKKLNVPVKAIETLRKNQGIPELEAGQLSIEDDLQD